MNGSRVLVIGGSVGGLIAATALQKVGCSVDVYERSETRLDARGAGIRLQPVMVELLAKRADIDLRSMSTFTSHLRFLGRNNEVLHDKLETGQFTSWNTLYGALAHCFGDSNYHLSSAFVGLSQNEDNVVARFADGRMESADLVVFTDGINSTGRARLAPQAEPQYAGYVCWRGFVSEDQVEPYTRSLLEDATTYALLDHGHIAMYLMPGAGGELRKGQRLFNYVWYRNVPAGPEFDELMTDRCGVLRLISLPPGMVQERFVRELRAAALECLPPAAAELVLKTRDPFIQTICDVEVPRMVFGRACLLGDAAFGGRPHAGAATAKATVDAWALADALEAARGNVPQALATWEPGQLDLGRRLVDRNRRLGAKLQFENSAYPGDPEVRSGW